MPGPPAGGGATPLNSSRKKPARFGMGYMRPKVVESNTPIGVCRPDASGRGYELVYQEEQLAREKEQPPPSTSGRGDRNRPRERGHRERGREKLPENGSRHHRVGEWDRERQKRSRTRSRERERRRDASLPERHHDRLRLVQGFWSGEVQQPVI